MAIIFHITTREGWERARAQGSYRPEAFAAEGFIHCSTPTQVVHVANSRFRSHTGLVLLSIETERVAAAIRYENLEGGEQLFPHIYGALNLDAVLEAADFTPGSDGLFQLD
ncbi:MAG: DUF952 domain-containing protein [bacterium]